MKMIAPAPPTGNSHLLALHTHFGPNLASDTTQVRRDFKYVFLCFTNRCGSNFIAQALSSNGFLNVAGEFLNADTVLDNCQSEGLSSLASFINWLTLREGRNGFLLSKVSVAHLEVLANAGVLEQISDPIFIMITRSDILGQAISLDVAHQTGSWTHAIPARRAEADLDFSFERLTAIIHGITAENLEFQRFFGLNGLVPVGVNYEAFLRDPTYHVGVLADHLRVAGLVSHCPEQVTLRQQSSLINRTWRKLFLQGREDDREAQANCYT